MYNIVKGFGNSSHLSQRVTLDALVTHVNLVGYSKFKYTAWICRSLLRWEHLWQDPTRYLDGLIYRNIYILNIWILIGYTSVKLGLLHLKQDCSRKDDKQLFFMSILICEKTDCSPKYFKCPGFYCIPLRYVCNGLWECPGGVEELPHMNCHTRTCSGLFKCLDSLICIAPESLCDGIIDCPHGDDIQFCDMNLAVCPRSCTCFLYPSFLPAH